MRAMKVLLVNPKFPDTYWSFRHALPFEGKRSVFPPLGLLTVSGLLPRSCERRLVDLEIEPLDRILLGVVLVDGLLVEHGVAADRMGEPVQLVGARKLAVQEQVEKESGE